MKVEFETVKREVYIAEDGTKFYNHDKCLEYEEDLEKRKNGTRKTCSRCGGRGRINYHTEKYFDGGREGDHQWHESEESDVCPECNGKGYLELKWS